MRSTRRARCEQARHGRLARCRVETESAVHLATQRPLRGARLRAAANAALKYYCSRRLDPASIGARSAPLAWRRGSRQLQPTRRSSPAVLIQPRLPSRSGATSCACITGPSDCVVMSSTRSTATCSRPTARAMAAFCNWHNCNWHNALQERQAALQRHGTSGSSPGLAIARYLHVLQVAHTDAAQACWRRAAARGQCAHSQPAEDIGGELRGAGLTDCSAAAGTATYR